MEIAGKLQLIFASLRAGDPKTVGPREGLETMVVVMTAQRAQQRGNVFATVELAAVTSVRAWRLCICDGRDSGGDWIASGVRFERGFASLDPARAGTLTGRRFSTPARGCLQERHSEIPLFPRTLAGSIWWIHTDDRTGSGSVKHGRAPAIQPSRQRVRS